MNRLASLVKILFIPTLVFAFLSIGGNPQIAYAQDADGDFLPVTPNPPTTIINIVTATGQSTDTNGNPLPATDPNLLRLPNPGTQNQSVIQIKDGLSQQAKPETLEIISVQIIQGDAQLDVETRINGGAVIPTPDGNTTYNFSDAPTNETFEIVVTCESLTAATYPGIIRVQHNDADYAGGTLVDFNISCTVNSPLYIAELDPGQTNGNNEYVMESDTNGTQIKNAGSRVVTITNGSATTPSQDPAQLWVNATMTQNDSNAFTLTPINGTVNPDILAAGSHAADSAQFQMTCDFPGQNNIAPGTYTARLEVQHNDKASGLAVPQVYNFSCTVNGLPIYQANSFYVGGNVPTQNPTINILPGTTINLGEVQRGVQQTFNAFEVLNPAGLGPLTFDLALGGTDANTFQIQVPQRPFGSTVTGLTVQPNASSLQIPIRCFPQQGNNRIYSANISITHNADDTRAESTPNPFIYNLQCTGVDSQAIFSSNPAPDPNTNPATVEIDLGSVTLGETNPALYTKNALQITNNGTGNLIIETGSDFVGGSQALFGFPANVLPLVINGGNTETLQITCQPGAQDTPGDKFTDLVLRYNEDGANTETANYRVKCTAVEDTANQSVFNISPTPLQLAAQPGAQFTGNFVVTNSGGGGNVTIQEVGLDAANDNTHINVTDNYSTNWLELINAPTQGTQVGVAPDSENISVRCSVPTSATTGQQNAQSIYVRYTDDQNGTQTGHYVVICSVGASPSTGFTVSPDPSLDVTVARDTSNQQTFNTGTGVFTITNQSTTDTLTLNPQSSVPGLVTATQVSVPPGGTQTSTVTCRFATTTTTPTTQSATLTFSGTQGGTQVNAQRTVNCTYSNATIEYTSSPNPSGTLSMTTRPNVNVTKTITIQHEGTSATPLNLTMALTGTNSGQFSTSATTATVNRGDTYTLTIGCTAGASETNYSATLSITHNATNISSPAQYNLSCTVSTTATVDGTTDTTTTPTATPLPTTAPNAVTQCPQDRLLTRPYPQDATGEFLLVNCLLISQAAEVNITLAQVTTGIGDTITADNLALIQSNPALVTFWRMGSWFYVPSTYNPTGQIYNFNNTVPNSVYGVFYGAITRPVGSQGYIFAGTATGNVEEVLIEGGSNGFLPAVIATLFIMFVLAIFVSRRVRPKDATA